MKNCTQLCEMIKNESMVLNTPVWNEPPHSVNNDGMIDFSNQWDIPTETILPYVYIQNKCLTSLSKLTRLRLSHTLKTVQITHPPTCQTIHTRGNVPKNPTESMVPLKPAHLLVAMHAASSSHLPTERSIFQTAYTMTFHGGPSLHWLL